MRRKRERNIMQRVVLNTYCSKILREKRPEWRRKKRTAKHLRWTPGLYFFIFSTEFILAGEICQKPHSIWSIWAPRAPFVIYTPHIWSHHPVLDFHTKITRKYSSAMCLVQNWWSLLGNIWKWWMFVLRIFSFFSRQWLTVWCFDRWMPSKGENGRERWQTGPRWIFIIPNEHRGRRALLISKHFGNT